MPNGYFVIRSPGYRIWAMMRGFGEVGNGDQAVQWFEERLKVYPLATGPRKHTVTNASGMGANTLPPEDGSAFEMLNEIIQYEPAELFSTEQLGRLATLGIEKGKPFSPDARMQKIFDQAAKQGVAMSRAILYASREPEINYWPDRHWEKMFVRNTEFLHNGHADIDARTLWHYQAIVVSPNLLSTTPGVGTAYLTAFRDQDGAYLLGDKNYRLRVPANPPVKRFWAVTAYDPMSRSLLDSGGNITVGSLGDPEVNADGSVDIYFGPTDAPEGHEKNWIKTDPAKGFFVVFRFYGPLEGYIDKTWVMNDFERIDWTLMRTNQRVLLAACALAATHLAVAEDQSASELAKAAQNPIASLISVPIQSNINFDWGPEGDTFAVTNIQPVLPFKLNDDWNLVTRTILPVVSQPGLTPEQDRKWGTGDTVFTAFFVPADSGDWTWGVGPVVQLPTTSDPRLGKDEWGAGISAVALTMPGRWVMGGLVSNVWGIRRRPG